jgi:DNA-binding MarR family transcriptional regulator
MYSTDKEIKLLERIYYNKTQIRQRELAKIAELSLGMTNVILKRLVRRGWLAVKKLNNRNIKYIVTPDGIKAIAKRSYRYVKRTIKNIAFFKNAINNLILDIKKQGYKGVILLGVSDLEFIVEHLSQKHQLTYRYMQSPDKSELDRLNNFFKLFSEDITPDTDQPQAEKKQKNYAHLYEIVKVRE